MNDSKEKFNPFILNLNDSIRPFKLNESDFFLNEWDYFISEKIESFNLAIQIEWMGSKNEWMGSKNEWMRFKENEWFILKWIIQNEFWIFYNPVADRSAGHRVITE